MGEEGRFAGVPSRSEGALDDSIGSLADVLDGFAVLDGGIPDGKSRFRLADFRCAEAFVNSIVPLA